MPTIRPSALAALVASLATAACADTTMPPDDAPCAAATRAAPDGPVHLALGPGEVCVLRGEDAVDVSLAETGGQSEYLVAVQSVATTPSSVVSLELSVEDPAASLARAPAPGRGRGAGIPADPRPLSIDVALFEEEEASRAELTLRRNARRAVAGSRPLRSPTDTSPIRAALAGRAVARGDTLVLQNTVDPALGVDCDAPHDVVTVVRALGGGMGILEDVDAAGPVTDADYQAALAVLESVVFPVDTTYFGSPGDLDANGVVWVLFTPVVNRLTPRGSQTRVAGFFNPSDLSDPVDCAGSNAGEVLYVLAADPQGRFSDPIGAEFATTRAIGVAAHELTHLISAQRRVTLGEGSFADLEDAWLGEALAHAAETAVGFRAAGLAPGAELGFDALSADPELFSSFFFVNFRRAGFHLRNSNDTPALGDVSGADPGGIPSLEMRGFGWLFTRWLADHYAPAGAGLLGGPREEEIFRALSSGGAGHATGTANLVRVAASVGAPSTWEGLLEAYALSPLAEGRPGEIPAGTRYTSFALRDAYAALHDLMEDEDPFQQPYPLRTTEVGLGPGTSRVAPFDLRAATGRFFVLTGAGHPEIAIRLRTPGGAAVPPSGATRLVVLRSR